ncbi:MAG: hypothetical protein PUC26_00605 [Eubacteriales bacterium]|nr:hypothetical protein [Eubacteriales bacterium]
MQPGSSGEKGCCAAGIDRLTIKVEKHNQVVERVALLEHDMKTVWMRYDDLKKDAMK